MTDDLVGFLRARLDEDQAAAEAATPGPWTHDPMKQWHDGDDFVSFANGQEFVGYGGPSPFRGCIATTGKPSQAEPMRNAAHIALHDPARVLREVAAKREVINHAMRNMHPYTWSPWLDVLKQIAAVYAEHPDYREEWKP